MKEQILNINATPSKKLYLSIIADYDLNKAICELTDNAIDLWKMNKKSHNLEIKIEIDIDQQRIVVTDNAGGISEDNLSCIVSPGQSNNNETENIIGIFGVGTKRAVIALAQDITIKTRQQDLTYQIEIDDDWINHDDEWSLPVFKVTDIEKNNTKIELIKLRKKINEISIKKLEYYLSTTYSIYLRDERIKILLNNKKIDPIDFENWAYPPEFKPKYYYGSIKAKGTKDEIDVIIICGLTKESNDESGEYGVYFYCNDRLIARGLKTYDVGFGKGLAGKPGDEISLARIIVQLNGKPKYMPWNSSKSDINTSNEIFLSLQEMIFKIVKHVTSLSRRLRSIDGGWSENVFKYSNGSYKEENINDFTDIKPDYFPPLPKSTRRFGNVVKQENKNIAKDQPWTTGLYESIIAVDLILKTKLEQRNRIALILLDSNLEIAFKEYLANIKDPPFSEARINQIFNRRQDVHDEIKQEIDLSDTEWRKIKHFYNLRCSLVHRRTTDSIDNNEIKQFLELVEKALFKMYGLKFPEKNREV